MWGDWWGSCLGDVLEQKSAVIPSHPIYTPEILKMERENHGFQKDLSFYQGLIFGFHVKFRGCNCQFFFLIARFIFLGEATHTAPTSEYPQLC